MAKIVFIVLAAITLAGSAVSNASAGPIASGSKPSSFAPQPHSNDHVYGAPIEPPIVGHAKAAHHDHVRKKRSTSAKTRDAQRAHVHPHKAKAFS